MATMRRILRVVIVVASLACCVQGQFSGDSDKVQVPPLVPVPSDYGDGYDMSMYFPEGFDYFSYLYAQNVSLDITDMTGNVTERNRTETRYPQSASVCMPPIYEDVVQADYVTITTSRHQRRILSYEELDSARTKMAVMKATELYHKTNEGSSQLEMTEITSGCRQNYAGELLFLVFTAKETIICDTEAVNATCTENTMREVECRARIHYSIENGWLPFQTLCHEPSFYEIERKSVIVKYL